MARLRYKVTYADGTEKIALSTPRAEVMTEERFSGIAGNQEAALRVEYYCAWASLNRSGQEPDDWETFLDKIVEIENITPKKVPQNPTDGAAPPPAPSSP